MTSHPSHSPPRSSSITLLSSGVSHSLFLTEDNVCSIWGSNRCGQLGLPKQPDTFSPSSFQLPTNERISFIICGYNYTMCITVKGECYCWGRNANYRLGLGDEVDRPSPTKVTFPNHPKISFITCGVSHSICLTVSNECYVWGNNVAGQLGLGDQTNRQTPTKLDLPDNERIWSISCTYKSSICISENNECYVWGANESGQLGLGDDQHRAVPTKLNLPSNDKPVSIVCGGYHTFCLTQSGDYYVWGKNRFGQLGLGDESNRLSPTKFRLPTNEQITFVSCGAHHSIYITQTMDCYVCGNNESGQLGLDLDSTERSSIPIKHRETKIKLVACGAHHTLGITKENQFFGWGRNNIGQLGLGYNSSND